MFGKTNIGGQPTIGNAVVGDVLAGKTFSKEGAIGLVGTMPNRGTFNLGLGVTVPAGYYSGGTAPGAPGNTILIDHNTTVETTVAAMTKRKAITVGKTGIYRITFNLRPVYYDGSAELYGRIYKNGSPFGLLRTSYGYNTSVYFVEDLLFSAGDELSLYLGTSASAATINRNQTFSVGLNLPFTITL